MTADGLEDPGASNNANHRIWQAPAKAGSQTVKSEWVNGTVGRLTAFDYEQVTGISVENRNDYRPVSIVTEGTLYVDTKVTIDAQTPCNSLPLEFHTETPKVCTGPEGESTWPGENHYGGFAKLYAEGICKLGFSVPGGPILARESFTVFKVKPTPEGLSRPGFGNYCEMEGSTACDYSSDGIGLCKNNRWVEDGYCDRNEVCDFVADTSKGCVKGGPCAQCRGLN